MKSGTRSPVPVGPPRGPSRYLVHVGSGLCSSLGSRLASAGYTRAALVADRRVDRLHGAALAGSLAAAGLQPLRLTMPAGEAAKRWAAVSGVHRALARAALDRGAVLVSLGGGALTDAAGFAAATWLRGIAHVPVPTSLIGMVDASVGGKTGIDLPEGKNLVGAFHDPAMVLCDPEFLATLPPREYRSGLAEVVKTAFLAAGPLWSRVRSGSLPGREDAAALDGLLTSCVAFKARVVTKDPREQGFRRVLNLGHTVGHGLEAAAGFGKLRHGEAVAVGLVASARVARALDLCSPAVEDQLEGAISAQGLPVRAPGLDPAKVLGFVRRDKKRRAGRLAMVLPERPGHVRIVEDVPERLLARVVRDLCRP